MRRLAILASVPMMPLVAAGGAVPEVSIAWKWLNFALLAVVLWKLGQKFLGPYLQKSGDDIQSGLREAAKMKEDAETRIREIELRVAGIEEEIQRMRESSRQEMQAEAERIRAETARTIAKIQAHARLEIASATKLAKQELRVHAADLAIELASSEIRRGLTPAAQAGLVKQFVAQLATQDGAH